MKTTQHTQHSAPMDLAQFETSYPPIGYDFRGINFREGYAERIATFTPHKDYGDRFGPLFAAAPAMLAELKQLRTQRDALAGALDATTKRCEWHIANDPKPDRLDALATKRANEILGNL